MALLRKRIGPCLSRVQTKHFPHRLVKERRQMQKSWIGIGGNIGDMPRRFERLWHLLLRQPNIWPIESSSILINPPFGYLNQPHFHNAVLYIATSLTPTRLLSRLQRVERSFGRVRSFKDAPRTLDLDILFYGDRRIDRLNLQVPHPRWHLRDSVKLPLLWMRTPLPTPARKLLKRGAAFGKLHAKSAREKR